MHSAHLSSDSPNEMEISVREVGVPAKKQCVFLDDTSTTLAKIREQLMKDDLDLPELFVFVSKNDNEITKQQEERLTLDHICSKNLAGKKVEILLVVKSARPDTEKYKIDCMSKPDVGKVKTRSQKNKRPTPYQVKCKTQPFQDVVVIKKSDGKKFKIKMKPTEKLEELHSQIENKTGIPPHRQLLGCNGIPLMNQTDIKFCDCISGIDFTEKIDLKIHTIFGKILSVNNINENADIEQIIDYVTMTEGIPRETQRYVFNDREININNGGTLLDYGINHESKLLLLLRLTGS